MIRYILLALMLAAFGVASWHLNQGRLDPAINFASLGAGLLVAALAEPDKLLAQFWPPLRQAWGGLGAGLDRLRQARRDAKAGKPAKAARQAAKPKPGRAAKGLALPLAPAVPAGPSLLERLQALKALMPQSVEFSWFWILGVAALFLAAGQYTLLVKGSVIQGLPLTAFAFYLFWRWTQRESERIRLGVLNTFPLFMITTAAGLFLWFVGVRLIWGEVESKTYLGAALTWAGTLIGAWGCKRFIDEPMRADEAEEGVEAFGLYELPPHSHGGWGMKGVLLAAAGVLLITAFAASNYLLWIGFLLLSMACFLLAFPVFQFPFSGKLPFLPEGGQRLLAVAGLGVAGLSLWMGFHGQGRIEAGLVDKGLWWFFAGGLLLSLGLAAPAEPGEQPRRVPEMAALALVAVAAFLLRFINVGLFPYGVEGDEAGYGIVFEALQREPQIIQNYFRFNNVGVALYWLGAFFVRVFGITPQTIRLASVVYGTLSILSFYFLARLILRWQAALLAAVALTVSTWHLHYSRFGHLNISQVFVQSVCVYFFWKGMFSRKLWHFAVGGVALGLTFMAHTAGKLVPFMFFAFFLYLGLVHGKILVRRSAGILVFLAFSWATIAPVMTYYLKFPVQGTGRIKEVSIMNNQNTNAPADVVSGAVQNFRVSMLMFNHVGDNRSRDNALAPQPMLDHWSGVLFILGFGFVLYYWKLPFYAFLLIAFFGTLSASIISVEAPQSLRTAGNIPLVFLFVGVLFDRLLEAARRAFSGLGEKLALLGLAGLLVVMGQSNLKRYFGNTNYGWDLLPTLIGIHAGHLGPQYDTRFFAEGFGGGHPPVTLFAQGAPVRSHAELLECLPVRGLDGRGFSVAFADRYRDFSEYAAWLYPQAEKGIIKTKIGTPIYDTFTLKPEQVRELYGLAGVLTDARGLAQPLSPTAIDFPRGLPGAAGERLSAVWKGGLFVGEWSELRLALRTQGEGTVHVDGREVARTAQGRVDARALKLPIGPHRLEVRYQGRAGEPLSLTWEKKPTESGGRYWALSYASPAQAVPLSYLLREGKVHGLTQRFYAGRTWEGPYTAKVDAVILGRWIDWPIPGPFSCQWTGFLNIEAEGDYRFQFNSPNFIDIEVGGRLVERKGQLPVPTDGRAPQGVAHLRPGRHPFKVRFSAGSQPFMELTWSHAGTGGAPKMIPPALLEPELVF